MYRERKWVRNPKHRKYKPGEESADVRKDEETRGQEEVQSNEEQQPKKGDG
mgnify:CR=1 FL=1